MGMYDRSARSVDAVTYDRVSRVGRGVMNNMMGGVMGVMRSGMMARMVMRVMEEVGASRFGGAIEYRERQYKYKIASYFHIFIPFLKASRRLRQTGTSFATTKKASIHRSLGSRRVDWVCRRGVKSRICQSVSLSASKRPMQT